MTKLQAVRTKDILLHVSRQLSDRSVPAFVEPEPSVTVASHWPIINSLLVASLACVLIVTYLAVLTRGWVQDFEPSWKPLNVPGERARKGGLRLQGPLVAALLLIRASLIVYIIFLVLTFINLHRRTIADPTLAILAVGLCIRWSLRRNSWTTTHKATDDTRAEHGGSETHLANSNRLRAATSNTVEKLPSS
jgi:hypothetical protein